MPRPIRNDKSGLPYPPPAKRPRRIRDGNSEIYLVRLRDCPCVITGQERAGMVHHLILPDQRGMGYTSPDRWGVPLSEGPHLTWPDNITAHCSSTVEHERSDVEWFACRGIDVVALCTALWGHRDDLESMRRIAWRAHQRSQLHVARHGSGGRADD